MGVLSWHPVQPFFLGAPQGHFAVQILPQHHPQAHFVNRFLFGGFHGVGVERECLQTVPIHGSCCGTIII